MQKTIGRNWNVEVGLSGFEEHAAGHSGREYQPASVAVSLDGRGAADAECRIPISGRFRLRRRWAERPSRSSSCCGPFRASPPSLCFAITWAIRATKPPRLKLEKRFSHGLTVNAAYTFSKLIDDASSVFSQTIFTGPVLNNTGAADAYNRHLEKDVSSGDIPRVFALGWVYDIPRLWKISGWQIAGLVRVQAGDAVAVTQATNNNSSLGFAVQRPNRIGDPNEFADRTVARYFDTAAFTGGAAVRHRHQFTQSGPRTRTSECRPDDREDFPDHGALEPRIPRGSVQRVEYAAVERSRTAVSEARRSDPSRARVIPVFSSSWGRFTSDRQQHVSRHAQSL